jgi:tetratricopeptide (TPR) repeat protein
MWDLAVREEDYSRADSLLRRKFTPEKLPLGHRAMLAIVRRDTTGLRGLLSEARKQKSGYPWAPEWIAVYLNDFKRAVDFADAALASPRPQSLRAPVHRLLGLLALAQGRWSAAGPEFAQAESNIPSVKRLHALSATWPFLAVPEPELASLRTELEQWDPSADPPEPNEGLAATLRPELRLYLLGLLSSRLGQHERALEYAAELEGMKPTPEAAELVRDLSRTIRADVALKRGNAADALKLLEPVKGEVPPELITTPFFSQEGSRYLRAEALYQLGRDQDALRWFTHAFEGTPNELVYLAPSHLRQAELYERLGDRKQAVEHYSRFIQLWNSCDPELRPRVTEARARLASLVGEEVKR